MFTAITETEAIERTLYYLAETLDSGAVLSTNTNAVRGFLKEAAIRVVKVAPLHLLGNGNMDLPTVTVSSNGVGTIELCNGITRLISLKMGEWKRPVTTMITEADPRYTQQLHIATRGGKNCPVVAITNGGSNLELYSTSEGDELEWFTGINVDDITDCPKSLLDPICWMAASLFLTSVNEVDAATVAMNKSIELIQL
jgi:hypothetical protein